jgi:hypothetical protein
VIDIEQTTVATNVDEAAVAHHSACACPCSGQGIETTVALQAAVAPLAFVDALLFRA